MKKNLRICYLSHSHSVNRNSDFSCLSLRVTFQPLYKILLLFLIIKTLPALDFRLTSTMIIGRVDHPAKVSFLRIMSEKLDQTRLHFLFNSCISFLFLAFIFSNSIPSLLISSLYSSVHAFIMSVVTSR